jgi:16S rRNA (cytosine967-C5)-methyltransferase
MKPTIQMIMRSAVYQIFYMDNVPNSAICNEAVNIATKLRYHNLKGFVNGVLRSIVRNEKSIVAVISSQKAMSIKYSIPQWILDMWFESYDVKTITTMAEDFLQSKPTSIRIDENKMSKSALMTLLSNEGATVEEVKSLPYALLISGYNYLESLESFRKGYFYVQDISSMWVGELANPSKDSIIIDVCAAPGGKALHMAEKLAGTGHVYARDLSDEKVALIAENIQRAGLSNITAEKQDAIQSDEKSLNMADIVIADLPCSGLGIIGKKPDIKYKVTKAQTEILAHLQEEILNVVCKYVKVGGKLLYSTCTINKNENEENVARFLEAHSEFELVTMKQQLPGVDEGDGFFIAEMKKIV